MKRRLLCQNEKLQERRVDGHPRASPDVKVQTRLFGLSGSGRRRLGGTGSTGPRANANVLRFGPRVGGSRTSRGRTPTTCLRGRIQIRSPTTIQSKATWLVNSVVETLRDANPRMSLRSDPSCEFLVDAASSKVGVRDIFFSKNLQTDLHNAGPSSFFFVCNSLLVGLGIDLAMRLKNKRLLLFRRNKKDLPCVMQRVSPAEGFNF